VLDISSKGVAFTSEQSVSVGSPIQFTVSWPILLDGKTKIMLVAEGRVVRTDRKVVAVKIRRYEFRTQKK
jgi:hypothetical protein